MKKIKIMLLICFVILVALPKSVLANEEQSKYGIVISNEKGKYTFYDLNRDETSEKITASIESLDNKLMVPLKKLSKLSGLSYSYNSKRKEATVINKNNGRKIVYKKNSKYAYYYSNLKAKGVKKALSQKVYTSKISSSIMVHMSSLKWVMGSNAGYSYYGKNEMSLSGYDTLTYSGLIVYNPYGKESKIPLATSVEGISKTVKITIPEGYSVSQIFDLLVKKGVCTTTDSLYEQMEQYDFTYYSLVKDIVPSESRSFLLEGYLFPDTYEFYRLSKPQDVIGKFLRNAEVKLSPFKEKAEELGLTMDEVLTIASLIEKEAGNKEIQPIVSSVIHNRLEIKMKLGLDASIYYIERYVKPYITGDINRYNSFYNTYKCPALPAGPISNPGINAIKAALNPADTNYLYFYSDDVNEYHFSEIFVEEKKSN